MTESKSGPEHLWASLPADIQFEVARSVARRRAREWKRTYPNLVSSGAGFKTKRGRRHKQTICLRFLLSKKWKKRRSGGVPCSIRATIVTKKGRRVVAIPTDVEILGKGRLQGGLRASSPGGGTPEVMGAACCRVRSPQAPGQIFVLGCHHVLTRSLVMGGLEPSRDSEIQVRPDDGPERRMGRLFDFAALTPAPPRYGMDAALGVVEDETGIRPWKLGEHPRSLSNGLNIPHDYFIWTPGGRLGGRFLSQQFDVELKYGKNPGITVRINTVYETLAKTDRGDSGSPLIDVQGRLLAMHFYGTWREIHGKDEQVSLAIPAYELFRPGVFKIPIELDV